MSLTTLLSVTDYWHQEQLAPFRSEYHDGVVFPMAGTQPAHTRIKINLSTFFDTALPASYTVWNSDTQVGIPGTHSYVYPDLSVVHGPPAFHTDAPIAVLLNPLLLVEIISPTSASFDRGDTFTWYKTIPTLQAYLLVEQAQVHLTQWERTAAGWAATTFTSLHDVCHLASVPASLPLQTVYRRVDLALPT